MVAINTLMGWQLWKHRGHTSSRARHLFPVFPPPTLSLSLSILVGWTIWPRPAVSSSLMWVHAHTHTHNATLRYELEKRRMTSREKNRISAFYFHFQCIKMIIVTKLPYYFTFQPIVYYYHPSDVVLIRLIFPATAHTISDSENRYKTHVYV